MRRLSVWLGSVARHDREVGRGNVMKTLKGRETWGRGANIKPAPLAPSVFTRAPLSHTGCLCPAKLHPP